MSQILSLLPTEPTTSTKRALPQLITALTNIFSPSSSPLSDLTAQKAFVPLLAMIQILNTYADVNQVTTVVHHLMHLSHDGEEEQLTTLSVISSFFHV